jgi:hypothetical protein
MKSSLLGTSVADYYQPFGLKTLTPGAAYLKAGGPLCSSWPQAVGICFFPAEVAAKKQSSFTAADPPEI